MYLAPFTDALLFTETMGKARFWEQTAFHGVDLSPLYPDAKAEMFGKERLIYRTFLSRFGNSLSGWKVHSF